MRLILTLVLPLTIIIFGNITKWRYVSIEDGANEFLYGFPLPFMCRGWHTSLSLQIFVSELVFDFLVYLAICLTITLLIDRYLKPIVLKKYVTLSFYGFAFLTLFFYGILFSKPNNVFKAKRDFKYHELQSGYKFVWQKDER